MPDARRRHAALTAALLSTVLLAGIVLPTAAASQTPPGLDHFLQALGHVESGGRYNARNPHTGAYGKYQVMPYMWRVWSRHYLGSSRARPTPANQERLVRAAATSAYWKFGRWEVVAYWWLNGRAQRNTARWDRYSRRYVGKVMRWYEQYGGASAPAVPNSPAPSPSPATSPASSPSPVTSPASAPAPSPSPATSPASSPSPSPATSPSSDPSPSPSPATSPASSPSPSPSPSPSTPGSSPGATSTSPSPSA